MQSSKIANVQGMSLSSAFLFYLHSAWQDARRRCCSYVLSFLSVTIVVAAAAVS
jgi:hypothetical protein